MQTNVQNQNTVRLGSVICRVRGVNIGALRSAKFSTENESFNIEADNARFEPVKKVKKASLSADSLEIDVARLVDLDGMGTTTNLASESKNITNEVLSTTSIAAGTTIRLAKSNNTLTPVTAVTVKNGATTIDAADYTIVVNQNTKRSSIRFNASVTVTAGQEVTINYTYQSHAAVEYTVADLTAVVGLYPVEFVNTNKEGKEFVIGLYSAYQDKGIDWGFQSDEKLSDVMTHPLEFVAFPDGEDGMLYYIRDEQGILA